MLTVLLLAGCLVHVHGQASPKGLVSVGCDVSQCTKTGPVGAERLACSLDSLLDQHRGDRKLVAATYNRKHPAQTYLIDPNPFPSTYALLSDAKVQGVFALLPLPALDYCYTVARGKNFATNDLMGLIEKVPCGQAGALPFNASVLEVRDVFVNQHGGEYTNSLHAFSCRAHFVFGGCNENVPLDGNAGVLAGVEDAVVVDHAVNIATRWGSSYYHWLLEELPRLAYVLPMLRADPSLKIITHDHRANRRVYEWLGLSASQVLPVRGSEMFFVRTLLVPPVAHCGRPALTASQAIRQELFRHFRTAGMIGGGSPPAAEGEQESDNEGHIVVIARGGTRHTVNHVQLLAALQSAFPDRAFVEYGPSFVSLEDTARIFGNARGVVGVHGAGITNMIFSPSSAFLLEFHPHESNQIAHPNVCHQGSAHVFGQRHHMVWLAEGAFNDGVTIPVDHAIAGICALDGGPASTCDDHADLGEPVGPAFLTRQRV